MKMLLSHHSRGPQIQRVHLQIVALGYEDGIINLRYLMFRLPKFISDHSIFRRRPVYSFIFVLP